MGTNVSDRGFRPEETTMICCAHYGIILLLTAAVLALCTRPANAADPFLEKVDLFKAGEGGYVMYRIPGVTVTPKGTILVHCEGRQGSGDWTQQDILLRRSTDNGKTWTEPKVLSKRPPDLQPNPAGLRQGLTKPEKVTAHNAICIAERETGAVHMLYGIEYSRFFHIVSADEGENWSEPVDITEALTAYRKDYPWIVVGNGCGHGIQLTKGPHAGRMLAAFWFSLGTGGHAHRPSDLGVLFSDDHGKTWQAGGFISRNGDASVDGRKIVNPSETMLIELSDGRVMANIRSESESNRRLIALSADDGAIWQKPAFHNDLPEPICMASMIRPADGGILFSNPDNLLCGGKPGKPGQTRDRRNVTVRLSRDDGKTWTVKRPIEEGFSGYCDLGVLPDGTLLCFYERGAAKGNHYSTETLTLARFNMAWLTEEKRP
jgi:sialidase-1